VIFIADAMVPDPVVRSLSEVKFHIKRIQEISEIRPDRPVMQACLDENGILITFDLGIPSQAYLYEIAQNGLTVIQMRWKTSTHKDWQEMVGTILKEHHTWEAAASKEPSIISVNNRNSRIRPWSTIPPLIVMQALLKDKTAPEQGHFL
jgi:hypothetical protein